MVTEKAMSRELMGKIVDEVFDGAIEDASVIEEIYASIKRHEAALSAAEPAWWIVTTDMGKVIFHGSDKDRAYRVAGIHGREAQALYGDPPAPSVAVKALQEAAELTVKDASYHLEKFRPHCLDALKSALSAQVQDVAGWQDISTAPKNTKVLAGYKNECGNWRTVTACYHTQLEWSDEYGDHEEEYAPETWYEESDSGDVIYPTRRAPTHWMPLPVAPAAKQEG